MATNLTILNNERKSNHFFILFYDMSYIKILKFRMIKDVLLIKLQYIVIHRATKRYSYIALFNMLRLEV